MHKIKEFVKSHRSVYAFYFYIMSGIVNFIKIFTKSDDKLILFVSYGGKHYSDSPKYIFEEMRSDPRFTGFHFVWAFVEPQKHTVTGADKIKIDTFKYYITALKARCWITNVIIERALKFTGKNTFYLCTSHGIPLKRKTNEGESFKPLYNYLYDKILAQSSFDAEIQKVEFNITDDKIELIGYPRNDKFCGDLAPIRRKICSLYNIPEDKKIILYAPTYRDWNKGIETLPIDIKMWESTLADKYVLLFRAHPTVKYVGNVNDSNFYHNVTNYSDLDELLIASDMLISDYSSMFFDYSILHRPMLCWAYDYEEFRKIRDLQVNVVSELEGGEISQEQLLQLIIQEDHSNNIKRVVAFQKKYVTVFGNSAKKSVDLIYKHIA